LQLYNRYLGARTCKNNNANPTIARARISPPFTFTPDVHHAHESLNLFSAKFSSTNWVQAQLKPKESVSAAVFSYL
jgi:hypothetical protein